MTGPTARGAAARAAPLVLVVLVALGGVGLAVWGSYARSLIPQALDDRVVAVRLYSESGQRLRTLELAGGDELVVDRAAVATVSPGDHLRKRAGERELHVDGRTVTLAPSAETGRLAVVGALAVGVVAGSLLLRLRGCGASSR
jgi:hypothetical protein